MIASSARFSLGATLVILPLALLAREGASLGLWQAMLVCLIVGVPVWLTLAYLSAVRKAHATAILARPVWWGGLLSGHLARMACALIPAVSAGFGMVAAILTQQLWAVLWVVLAAVLILVSARLVDVRAARSLRPFAHGSAVVRFAVGVTAIALTLAAMLWSIRPPAPDTVSALFAAPSAYTGSSAMVALIAEWAAFVSGAQAMAEVVATGQGAPAWILPLWHGVALFGYHLGLALAMASPLLLTAEARRVLAPTDGDVPLRVPLFSIAVASAVAVILGIVMLQTVARIELMAQLVAADDAAPPMLTNQTADGRPPNIVTATDAQSNQREPSPLSPAGLLRQVQTELIGDLQCPPGTIAAIEAMDAEFRSILTAQEENLRVAVDTGFDAVRANIPAFLDWYYSLSAEYLRTANLLIGNGVEYLETQFSDKLEQGSPLAGLGTAITALSANQLLAQAHHDNRAAQLASCALALPQDGVQTVVTGMRSGDLLDTNLNIAVISFETRLAAAGLGGAAGLVTGGIMAKIGAKAIASGMFKMAAAALAKIAGGKAISLGGGILLGAGSGAAAGSVVPGAGTTAGAVAGGIVGGVAVMLGVDFAILKLDEEISRADFEAEINASIDASEAELLALLGLALP